MSGHSKWHSIKHKKAKEDAKRGNIFGKLSRNIIVAVREGGGGDPRDNIALANAIAKAKEYNMPQSNIERAIKRGTGEIEGENYESIIYEGYGPGGIALIIEIMTENRNRTASDIRNILTRYNGTLGESGSVSWQFERKGVIIVGREEVKDEEEFMLNIIDAGAEENDEDDDEYEIRTSPADFTKVRETLVSNNIKIKSSEIAFVPKTTIKLSKDEGMKALRLIDALDEHDDVQNVNTNLEITDELLDVDEET
ncbi:MAG: YebC/PmpR family DNA-binding transcriptional regulator [Actinomycetota bacterium]|nr:YebC/PmpR family DNA-binding transcriptional regulator [Actinomycetota bacterium]